MGLKNDLQTDIAESWNTDLADAVQGFTLLKGDIHYSPQSGGIAIGQNESGSWRGVFSKTNKRYIKDGAELPVETKVICLTNEAPFPPDVNHWITNERGECYRILRVEADPTFAVYTLLCRAGAHGEIQGPITT